MPVGFLNKTQQAQLSSFPDTINYNDLITYFTLTAQDKGAVPVRSSAANRLSFAIQLNKGEAMNSLRQFILFAREGKIYKRTLEDQATSGKMLELDYKCRCALEYGIYGKGNRTAGIRRLGYRG